MAAKEDYCSTLKSILVLCLFALLCACATNPVTGEKELNLLSDSQAKELGAQSDKSIIAQYGLHDDGQLSDFVKSVGERMSKISHRPNLDFHFRVLDSPVINAFAVPGGYVYFTRGILAYMNSAAELAGVMGHEIGHITAKHGAKAYTRAQLAQVGFAAGMIFSETFREYGDLAQIGVSLLFMKFSRDQEEQSDKLGVEYSTEVGYDAVRMARFFGTLDRLRDRSGQALPTWFSTHPDPEDREKRVAQLAEEAQAADGQKFKVDREQYLDLIDGIVFGEDPRHGFVEGDFFYHPTLDFQFPTPSNWQVVNTAQVVHIVNEQQDAAIQFSLSNGASAAQAAEKFVADSQARVVQSENTQIHGFPTAIRETLISGQQGDLRVLSYFIEKGEHVFVFHGYSTPANFDKYARTFSQVMSGFDRLQNEQARKAQPTRVKIVTVQNQATLETLLADYPSSGASAEELAIVNGMHLSDRLQRGDKLKVLTQ